MGNLKKTLKSGATVEIQVSSFEKAHNLLQVFKPLLPIVDDDLTLILNKQVNASIWECMDTCLYNGKRITRDTFEEEKAREDYLVVLKDVFEANTAPFLKGLNSKLSESKPTAA